MDIDRDRIDDAVLALLYLGRHEGIRTWKSFDWAAMERLHTKGLISDPVGKAKSVVFTDEGLRQSEALFRKFFAVRTRNLKRVPSNFAWLLRTLHQSALFTIFLVHRFIPKAIEFFLDHPADVPPA